MTADQMAEEGRKVLAAQLEAEYQLRIKAERELAAANAALAKERDARELAEHMEGEMAGEVYQARTQLAEAEELLKNLVAQIDKFAEQQGEADFYTGDARAFLARAKQTEGER